MRKALIAVAATAVVATGAVAVASTAGAAPDNRYFVTQYYCDGAVSSKAYSDLGKTLGVYGTEVKQATRNGGVLNVTVNQNGKIIGGVGFSEAGNC